MITTPITEVDQHGYATEIDEHGRILANPPSSFVRCPLCRATMSDLMDRNEIRRSCTICGMVLDTKLMTFSKDSLNRIRDAVHVLRQKMDYDVLCTVAQRLCDRIDEVSKSKMDLFGVVQQFQPAGSPPAYDEINMTRWVLQNLVNGVKPANYVNDDPRNGLTADGHAPHQAPAEPDNYIYVAVCVRATTKVFASCVVGGTGRNFPGTELVLGMDTVAAIRAEAPRIVARLASELARLNRLPAQVQTNFKPWDVPPAMSEFFTAHVGWWAIIGDPDCKPGDLFKVKLPGGKSMHIRITRIVLPGASFDYGNECYSNFDGWTKIVYEQLNIQDMPQKLE